MMLVSSQPAPAHSSDSPHDDVLQLWVERGRSFTQRAASLVSAWNANHEKAVSEYASVNDSQPEFLSSTTSAPRNRSINNNADTPIPSRISINRNYNARSSVRALRKQRLALIIHAEQQKQQEQEKLQQLKQQQKQQILEQQLRQKREEEERLKQIEKQRIQAEQRAVEEERRRQQLNIQKQQQQQVEENQRLERERIEKETAAAKEAAEKAAAEKAAAVNQARNKNNDPEFDRKYQAWKDGPTLDWLDDLSGLKQGQSDEALQDIVTCLNTYNIMTQHASTFRKDTSMKRIRLAAKRIITRAINQSSGTVEQARMKIIEIINGLRELDASTGNNISARAFGMHEFSTQILLEANNSIAGNQELAYGLAAVVIGVTAGCPDPQTMRNVVLGAIYSRSIISRPHFPSRKQGESLAEFRSRLGYKDNVDDDKQLEKDEDFIYRQRAYIHLLAAIFQTNIKMLQMEDIFGQEINNPFSITLAWTWIARIVNRRQRALIPEVIHAFLETAGYAMSLAFSSQFGKLMSMVKKTVIFHASPYASALSLSNMKALVADFEQNGHKFSESPKGRDMPLRDRKNT